MITISISGNTSQDIMKDFNELSNLLGKQSVSTVTATEVVAQTKEALSEAVENVDVLADNSIGKAVDDLAEEVKPTKRKRRTKEEIEAETKAKVESLQSEVAANQAEQVKFEVPQIPTTNIINKLPESPVTEQSAPIAHPIQQPVLNTNNAYTLDTFKSGLVMIINNLLSAGKLDNAWVAATTTQSFAG